MIGSVRPAAPRTSRTALVLGGLALFLVLTLLGGLLSNNRSNAAPPPQGPSGPLGSTATVAQVATAPGQTATRGRTAAPPTATRAGSTAAPAATLPPSPITPGGTAIGFGFSTHLMWYDLEVSLPELDRLHDAGLTTVRFDVAWRWIEPERKGEYDAAYLAKLDTILQAVDARGLTAIITIIETPAWARPADTNIFHPPTNRQHYADAAGVLAARYAARPNTIWEIWNEPNLPEFWEGGPNAADYTDLLKRAYKAIKTADPDAIVLGGSVVFNDLKFLGAMYTNGAQGHFDGLAHHPYAPGRSPDDRRDPSATFLSIEDMYAVMSAHGDGNKGIWITEFGWSLELVSDVQRATYLQQAIDMLRKWPYVRVFCVYTLRQDSGPEGTLFGFLLPDGTATRSWETYVKAVGSK